MLDHQLFLPRNAIALSIATTPLGLGDHSGCKLVLRIAISIGQDDLIFRHSRHD